MPDNPELSDILGIRFLALVKGGLKELCSPFADSLRQGEARWWELVQEFAVLLINLCVMAVKHLVEMFDFGLYLLDLCSGGLDIWSDIGAVTV